MKGRAVGYTRVSTGAQASSGLGIKAQEDQIRRFCDYKELELIYIYEDPGTSGGLLLKERPSGSALWTSLEETDEDPWTVHLVASKLCRLWRSRLYMHVELPELEQMKINVHTAKNGRTLVTGGEDVDREAQAYAHLFTEFTATIDELERTRASERAAEALAIKVARGEHVGAVSFGYERRGSDTGPNEADMATLGILWHLKSVRNMPYREICAELNRRKRAPHKRSKTWTQVSTKKQGGRLRKSKELQLLAREAFHRYLQRREVSLERFE